MTQLAFGTDFVQVPTDGSGKKTGFLLAAVSGGSLYIPAGVVSGIDGTIAEVKGSAPGSSDNGLVVRVAGTVIPDGNVAHDAADAGNPIKIGGKVTANAGGALPIVSALADRVDAAFDPYGRQIVAVGSAVGSTTAADGLSNTSGVVSIQGSGGSSQASAVILLSGNYYYNNTNWDRMRGDTNGLYIVGNVAHDAVDAGGPIKFGGYAKAAAPADVSADGDRVNAWFLRNGAQATVLTAAGALIGGDATNGLDVDVTRVTGTVTVDSELPAAAALADAVANPTVPGVGAFLMGFNGTTFDRVKTANTGRLQVDVVTGGGGGTQYVEDVAFGGNGTGTLMIARRTDTLATLTPVVDDAVGLRVNNRGALWVKSDGVISIDDNAGSLTVDSGATFSVQDSQVIADNAAFTDGTSKLFLGGYIFDEVAGTALTENDAAAARIDSKRAVVNVIEDATTRGQRASVSAAGRVSVDASGVAVPITDNASSLTVDAPVGTPVFVRLSDGSAAIATLPVEGEVAHDGAGASVLPLAVGGYASNAVPTDVSADTDIVRAWFTRKGTQIVANNLHALLDGAPWTLTSKTVQTSTTQTGSDVWTPAAGKKLVIISYQIQAGGTTAGTIQLWFGANADTTYTRGTDLAIFDGEFAPSATLKPGVVQTGLWIASAADHEVHLTTSAAINPLTITLWGYEV